LYEKFIDKFLATEKITEKETYLNLFNKLEKVDNFIINWENEDLDNFMKGIGSISVNTINKYLQFTREFYRYMCKQKGIKPKKIELTKDSKFYINYEKLKGLTIKHDHFISIKNNLTVLTEKGLYNYRDKVLFCLAWEGLSNSEIKNLREDDIIFFKTMY